MNNSQPIFYEGGTPKRKPKRKIRLTSLFFTLGLGLLTFNFLLNAIHILQYQPHALGAATVAFATSVVVQIVHPSA